MTSLISIPLTILSIRSPLEIPKYHSSILHHEHIECSSWYSWFSVQSKKSPDPMDHGRVCRSIKVLSFDSKPKDSSNSASSGAYYGYTDFISVVSATLFTGFYYSRTLDGVKLLIGQLLNLALLMFLFGRAL
ncbi:uncharacterized protein EV154DRAFT_546768 [Mucor mucedo]|uniref:uncharacterized protein n=1 Tax=Mucor mucedo TaxID=29922 RepID=UPI00221EFB97|nr:uncharacterized protein EV154DRAFT_546768 [Mucor mucedo]KAI7897367.1 hypothetical protein EV154DRAFT_546768 [Mucor mucedo]